MAAPNSSPTWSGCGNFQEIFATSLMARGMLSSEMPTSRANQDFQPKQGGKERVNKS